MFDPSVFVDFFSDLVRSAVPLVFLVVLIRVGFKVLVNAATGKKDLFAD